MAQEDKIKREADRIGLVLAKLLNKLYHTSSPDGDIAGSIGTQLQSELGIDISGFLNMDTEEDIKQFATQEKFSQEHLRTFGNILYSLANVAADNEMKMKLRDKALHVYEYIRANSNGTLFLDVEYRIRELKG
jgi:hypothetical protein